MSPNERTGQAQGFIFKLPDGSEAPFEQVFPEIVAVDVVIEETGPGNEGLGLRSLTRRSVRETINCSNPLCHGKGLALGDLLRKMVKNHQAEWQGASTCTSRKESGDACQNAFQVKVTIRFRA